MYILKKVDQQNLLRRFIRTGTLEGGWTWVYRDPSDNSEWILFRRHGERQGGGWPVLRTNPVPEQLADWMKQCFSSGNEDDIKGLAWELSSDFERWPRILDWLEANSAIYSKLQIGLFVKNLEVLQVCNKRSIIGKFPMEIDEDYHFFLTLAQRAGKLTETA
jgi:hypothetical protein